MVGRHHQLNGHEFEQALSVSDGQGSLAYCSSWVTKSQTWLSDWTTRTGMHSPDITLPTKVRLVKAMVFPVVMYGCESWTIKRLSTKELMLSNYGAGEDSWESLGQQRDQTSQSQRKSVLNIHWKDRCWSWSSNTLATWCEELTHSKRRWCWERLNMGGEEDDRGWDDWMAPLTRWTWVWAVSRNLW